MVIQLIGLCFLLSYMLTSSWEEPMLRAVTGDWNLVCLLLEWIIRPIVRGYANQGPPPTRQQETVSRRNRHDLQEALQRPESSPKPQRRCRPDLAHRPGRRSSSNWYLGLLHHRTYAAHISVTMKSSGNFCTGLCFAVLFAGLCRAVHCSHTFEATHCNKQPRVTGQRPHPMR